MAEFFGNFLSGIMQDLFAQVPNANLRSLFAEFCVLKIAPWEIFALAGKYIAVHLDG